MWSCVKSKHGKKKEGRVQDFNQWMNEWIKYYESHSCVNALFCWSNLTVLRYVIITARQGSCGKLMFSVVCVCHSICPRGRGVTITHDALDLSIQRPPPSPGLPFCTDTPSPGPVNRAHNWWHLLVKTGGLFKLVHLSTPNPPLLVTSVVAPRFKDPNPNTDIWWLVTEAHTVGMWAVRILL